MKKKTALVVCMWGIFIAAVAYALVSETTTKSHISLNGENLVALNREAVAAKVTNPAEHPYLYFSFTPNQQARLSNTSRRTEGASVEVTVVPLKNKKHTGESPFAFGLLYTKDFSDEKKLNDTITKRPLVTGDFSKLDPKGFSVSICLQRGDEVPVGFFVYGTYRFSVKRVQFSEAKIGWDRTGDVPLFSFTSAGGVIDQSFTRADLSLASNVFADKNTALTIMPKLTVGLFECKDIGTYESQPKVRLTIGGEELAIRRTKNQKDATLQTAALLNPFSKVIVSANGDMVSAIMLTSNASSLLPSEKTNNEVVTPIETDPGMIFDWPVKNWRNPDYELYSWEQFPQVLFFDTADYRIQGLFFTRLAYFVEKDGYKGTLVDDDFVETQHGYNAHDYKDVDLAAFFSKAAKESFKLNQYELLLRDILMKNKIIIAKKDGTYISGSGAVISISQESPGYLRNTFIAHESWHGIYFTDEDFRNTVAKSYLMFDEKSMDFIKTFWATQNGLHYDLDDEYLMQNEFMAYLMQQPLTYTKTYFLQVAGRASVNENEPELAAYVRETDAKPFVDTTTVLNQYAFDRWGLAAGRVSLISR
jgi:hypothetical protein